jgi:glycosyltransferase involved in cell wall biosynthesis
VDTVSASDFEPSGPSLKEIYKTMPVYDDVIRQNIDCWYFKLMMLYNAARRKRSIKIKARVVSFVKPHVPRKYYPMWHRYRSLLHWNNFKAAVKRKLISTRFGIFLKSADQVVKARSMHDRYMYIFKMPERTREDINKKLKKCLRLGSEFRIDRVRLYREMARLERIRGNGLIAATYLLRVMRLLGQNRFGDLEIVKRILVENGFKFEARVADSMYGPYPDQVERCAELLNQSLENNRCNEQLEYEFLDDRRKLSSYRVSIIVSLYNAATKLPKFLEMMQCQTMLKTCSAEIILIDSGSPGDDYAVFKKCINTLNIPIVYARCAKRETIQKAWNRGIGLARSPYLAFLGVDEVILPGCLEVLAAELDADPTLDWVVGNSLVTNVNSEGEWVNDIMLYDRSGYKQSLVYLETCYLSWVAGLYRRSIHDRFGYYDPTFGAAGDTEFKNRILPFIKTKAIPKTLGTFWNYPEERTTQSPRAEIEDLRAWYLHRTLAGVKYAFIKRDPAEAEDLFYTALRYRKSYCQHWSTDVEYAYNLGRFLQETAPNSPVLKYLDGVNKVLNTYRSLDWFSSLSPSVSINAIIRAQLFTARVGKRHRNLNNHSVVPPYLIFNDNRYEQHTVFWSTAG